VIPEIVRKTVGNFFGTAFREIIPRNKTITKILFGSKTVKKLFKVFEILLQLSIRVNKAQ
jgi:hypothetical protein